MLSTYGWSETLQRDFQPYAARGLMPARVVIQQRSRYRLITEAGEADGRVSGRFAHEAGEGGYPVTGDWLAVEPHPDAAVIQAVLPRATAFVRKAAHHNAPQVVAANVDVALLTASVNADLNLRRLERYLAAAYESGAAPVVVLTKTDTCADTRPLVAAVEAVAFAVPVISVSAATGEGLDILSAYLQPRRTAVLLGSSGVGKSTLVNALSGQALMATQAIREADARGRHTTTHRELILLPSGALILDTPGMRELGLWDAGAGLASAFGDVVAEVEGIAARCRFRDCGHEAEPGCAIQAALVDGGLDPGRWASFQKLQRELEHEVRKEDPRARAVSRKLWISRSKAAKARASAKRGDHD